MFSFDSMVNMFDSWICIFVFFSICILVCYVRSERICVEWLSYWMMIQEYTLKPGNLPLFYGEIDKTWN